MSTPRIKPEPNPHRWRYGCDKEIMVCVPRGPYDAKSMTVRCGSTAYDGGVNQCVECARKHPQGPVPEYGDIEHYDDGI